MSLGLLHPGTLPRTVVASPDNQRVAYAVRRGSKWFAVIDGKPVQKEYDLPIPFDLPMPFTDLSLEKQEKLLSVLDNDLSTQDEFVAKIFGRPLFSPDCRRLAYVAHRTVPQQIFRSIPPFRTPVKHFLVVDGDEGEPYDRIVQGVLSSAQTAAGWPTPRKGRANS